MSTQCPWPVRQDEAEAGKPSRVECIPASAVVCLGHVAVKQLTRRLPLTPSRGDGATEGGFGMGELAGVCARAEDASRFWCGGLFRSWGVGR